MYYPQQPQRPSAVVVTRPSSNAPKKGAGWLIFVLLWVLAGLIGFIYSIVCFWKGDCKKNTGFNVGGLFIALLLGPLWWFYYIFAKPAGYCNDKMSSSSSSNSHSSSSSDSHH